MSDITAIINFNNANSRETYFTMHHVKEAHKYGKGKNVKVGIIDWCFGLKNHGELYENGVDVSGTPFFLNECASNFSSFSMSGSRFLTISSLSNMQSKSLPI